MFAARNQVVEILSDTLSIRSAPRPLALDITLTTYIFNTVFNATARALVEKHVLYHIIIFGSDSRNSKDRR